MVLLLPAVSRAYRISVEYRNNMQHSLQSTYGHGETYWFVVCTTSPLEYLHQHKSRCPLTGRANCPGLPCTRGLSGLSSCLHQPRCLRHGMDAIKTSDIASLLRSFSYNSPAKQQDGHFSSNSVILSNRSYNATCWTSFRDWLH